MLFSSQPLKIIQLTLLIFSLIAFWLQKLYYMTLRITALFNSRKPQLYSTWKASTEVSATLRPWTFVFWNLLKFPVLNTDMEIFCKFLFLIKKKCVTQNVRAWIFLSFISLIALIIVDYPINLIVFWRGVLIITYNFWFFYFFPYLFQVMLI